MVNSYQPSRPYLLFHPRFVCTYDDKAWHYQMPQEVYDLGWFKRDCFAIDVLCRKFPLLDVSACGLAWTLSNLPVLGFRGRQGKILNVEYVFGPPTQMTFDEVRKLYIESIVAMRRASQNGETPAQFRARNESYTNVKEFIESVGLMGKWPVINQKKSRTNK